MSYCEDYPCCGHEQGDCNGALYGSDESIKQRVFDDWDNGHGYCDHESGLFLCDDEDEDDTCDCGHPECGAC